MDNIRELLNEFAQQIGDDNIYQTIMDIISTSGAQSALSWVRQNYPAYLTITYSMLTRARNFLYNMTGSTNTDIDNKDFKFPNLSSQQYTSIPKIEQEKNLQSFEKFEEFKHIALFGQSNSGKSSWVVTQLCEGYFVDYETFIFVGASNTQDLVENLSKAVYADMVVNRGLKKESLDKETFRYFFYNNTSSVNHLTILLSQKQTKKTLIFFDDTQMDSKIFALVSKNLLGAKNSNITVITSVHAAVDNNNTSIQIRNASTYFVFFNPTEHNIRTVAKDMFDPMVFKKMSYEIVNPKQRVLILDKLTQEWFFGIGKHYKINTQSMSAHAFDSPNVLRNETATSKSSI
jgi:hypothetical protein